MPNSPLIEAFGFSRSISSRFPSNVASRMQEIMWKTEAEMKTKDVLIEVAELLYPAHDLMRKFSKLFLSNYGTLEVWQNPMGESMAVLNLLSGSKNMIECLGMLTASTVLESQEINRTVVRGNGHKERSPKEPIVHTALDCQTIENDLNEQQPLSPSEEPNSPHTNISPQVRVKRESSDEEEFSDDVLSYCEQEDSSQIKTEITSGSRKRTQRCSYAEERVESNEGIGNRNTTTTTATTTDNQTKRSSRMASKQKIAQKKQRYKDDSAAFTKRVQERARAASEALADKPPPMNEIITTLHQGSTTKKRPRPTF